MAARSDRLKHAARLLDKIVQRVDREEASREELDAVVAEIVGAQRELFGPRPRAPRGSGARQKILEYLWERVGQDVSGEELAIASGIQEWARRLRELRVESGYDITEVGNSLYRLESADPDHERAARWRVENEIRRSGGSAMERIQALLMARVGEVVSRAQIDYVANDVREGIRRVRELRDEFGWPISSRIDEPELERDEYRLVSADPADRRDRRQRLYREELRQRVFARDGYRCQACGRTREMAQAAGDSRFYLELHHKTAVAEELEALEPSVLNDEANLITLCHTDHLVETAAFQERRRRERAER